MKSGKLRLAFFAVCGIVCLLLIVLWARSFWTTDYMDTYDSSNVQTTFGSNKGTLFFNQVDWTFDPGIQVPHGWTHMTRPAKESGGKRWLGWSRTGVSIQVAVSHWSAILIFAALAAVPWLSWRFKLSTLLIAMTVIAALVAIAVATN